MQRILAKHLVRAIAQIERVDVVLNEAQRSADWDGNTEAPTSIRNSIAKNYSSLEASAKAMGAVVTSKSANRAVKKLRARKNPIKGNEMVSLNSEINNVLDFEVGDIDFYCLNSGANEYYNPKSPLFGEKVENRIPNASNDISEAGKCFATGRYTATVFHLMRAMEAAVQELSKSLRIAKIDREWGKLLSDIGSKIEEMEKGEERNKWSHAHATLYHVKQAWRNETMHPKATYTEEEAKEVFDAVKAFMRHLATLLPSSIDELLG